MKVVGLLSGGKDSVYNLCHCVANGHEVVAVASLGPGQGKDEIDSYMYQTVGHSGLKFIAEAMGLPLFTHVISGSAVNKDAEYGSREPTRSTNYASTSKPAGTTGDETEDLYELLTKVMRAVPELEAVSCGAILSNYQRVRVEHVCRRLGLVPLAYLWERDQKELLDEMIQAGMESVLVKVAGAGLGTQHLGKTLKQMQPELLRLNERFDLHPCGEGGEYETFTVDCPLFSKRVQLDKVTMVVTNEDPYSTVAHLHIDHCTLVAKPLEASKKTAAFSKQMSSMLKIPDYLEDSVYHELTEACSPFSTTVKDKDKSQDSKRNPAAMRCRNLILHPSVSKKNGWVAFSEVSVSCEVGVEVEEEVDRCFVTLKALLATKAATLLDICHMTVYLSADSMSLFPRINAVYSRYFGTSPPSRACVAVYGPKNLAGTGPRIKFEGFAYVAPPKATDTGSEILPGQRENTLKRHSLHVQSISYWAAANIGPYSQALTVGEKRMFIAGQIPLVPATLEPIPSPVEFEQEIALSLRHLRRVCYVAAREARWKESGGSVHEGGICWIQDESNESKWMQFARMAYEGWKVEHDASLSPIVFVAAAALPKGVRIEWQVSATCNTSTNAKETEYDSDDADAYEATKHKVQERTRTWFLGWREQGGTTIETHSFLSESFLEESSSSKIFAIRIFYKHHLPDNQIERQAILTRFGLSSLNIESVSLSWVETPYLWVGGDARSREQGIKCEQQQLQKQQYDIVLQLFA